MAISLGPEVAHNCLLLRVSRITKIFVTSDIITFLIQASGSGMQATEGNAELGHRLAMVCTASTPRQLEDLADDGLTPLTPRLVSSSRSSPLASTFSCSSRRSPSARAFELVRSHERLRACSDGIRFSIFSRKMYPEAWHRSDGTFSRSPGFVVRNIFSRQDFDAWKVVFWANCFACCGLMIRCVFRVVEYSQGQSQSNFIERGAFADQCLICPGFNGAIATNEAYIYCLDSLPLFVGLGVFCIYYPPRFLPQSSFIKGAASYSLELGQREPEKTYGSQ
jgi:hypothetical protein